MASHSLLDRLPAELRLKIYGLVFTPSRRITRRGRGFPVDLRVHSAAQEYAATIPDLALLTVSRSVYNEALATLYEVSTLVFQRSELCLSKYNKHSLKLFDHLTHLEIYEMQQGTCSTSEGKLCENCVNLSGIFHILTTLPRLRTIVFEYGDEPWRKEWDLATPFTDLRQALKDGHLRSSLDRVKVMFRDSELSCAWADPFSTRPIKDRSRVAYAVETMHMLHPAGLLPLQIARIWPPGVPVDLHQLHAIDAPGFLEAFDGALQEYVRSRPGESQLMNMDHAGRIIWQG
ncbi:hypothetical protein LTR10_007277 [Elasticomyces elasticus]|nr:hypothetical protein LTR10_007277 [Elasticomyces elasticus]KAK4979090.1 hypothetical protein LTR42_001592 [Elasticomyces elasticus]